MGIDGAHVRYTVAMVASNTSEKEEREQYRNNIIRILIQKWIDLVGTWMSYFYFSIPTMYIYVLSLSVRRRLTSLSATSNVPKECGKKVIGCCDVRRLYAALNGLDFFKNWTRRSSQIRRAGFISARFYM